MFRQIGTVTRAAVIDPGGEKSTPLATILLLGPHDGMVAANSLGAPSTTISYKLASALPCDNFGRGMLYDNISGFVVGIGQASALTARARTPTDVSGFSLLFMSTMADGFTAARTIIVVAPTELALRSTNVSRRTAVLS